MVEDDTPEEYFDVTEAELEDEFFLGSSIKDIKAYIERGFYQKERYLGKDRALGWAWERVDFLCESHRLTFDSHDDDWSRLQFEKWMSSVIGPRTKENEGLENNKAVVTVENSQLQSDGPKSTDVKDGSERSDSDRTTDNMQKKTGDPRSIEEKDKDRIIAIQNDKIKKLRTSVKYAKRPAETELQKMADECRMKNGKINYSKLGKMLGKSHPTAKVWCRDDGIK